MRLMKVVKESAYVDAGRRSTTKSETTFGRTEKTSSSCRSMHWLDRVASSEMKDLLATRERSVPGMLKARKKEESWKAEQAAIKYETEGETL